jgi:heme-degrading monooxygenase HmoA
MICRIWTARATHANTPKYLAIARENVIAELRQVPGFRGAVVLTREAADDRNIQFLTFWESTDAILAFAGDDATRAVILPEAEAVLLEADQRAEHWKVELREGV